MSAIKRQRQSDQGTELKTGDGHSSGVSVCKRPKVLEQTSGSKHNGHVVAFVSTYLRKKRDKGTQDGKVFKAAVTRCVMEVLGNGPFACLKDQNLESMGSFLAGSLLNKTPVPGADYSAVQVELVDSRLQVPLDSDSSSNFPGFSECLFFLQEKLGFPVAEDTLNEALKSAALQCNASSLASYSFGPLDVLLVYNTVEGIKVSPWSLFCNPLVMDDFTKIFDLDLDAAVLDISGIQGEKERSNAVQQLFEKLKKCVEIFFACDEETDKRTMDNFPEKEFPNLSKFLQFLSAPTPGVKGCCNKRVFFQLMEEYLTMAALLDPGVHRQLVERCRQQEAGGESDVLHQKERLREKAKPIFAAMQILCAGDKEKTLAEFKSVLE